MKLSETIGAALMITLPARTKVLSRRLVRKLTTQSTRAMPSKMPPTTAADPLRLPSWRAPPAAVMLRTAVLDASVQVVRVLRGITNENWLATAQEPRVVIRSDCIAREDRSRHGDKTLRIRVRNNDCQTLVCG